MCPKSSLVRVMHAIYSARLRPESEARKGCGSSVLFPRRTVCFLKTHKCASSAVQNLLMRYGDSHDLRFVLPSWSNYLGFTELFNRSMAAGHPPFDMLAHHARFNEGEMRAVLGPNPVFITIVREPATLFESLYSYYDFELERARRNQSLSGLLKNLTRKQTKLNLGFNQMSFDLGLEPAQFGNESAVRGFVQRMDATFDLVMVAERMNESLVLLRDLLCWSLDDVVLFRLNARQKRYRHTLSPELAEDFRALNSADVQLYEHFKRRFDQRVREFGQERMARELFLLEERTRFWHRRCVKEVSALQTRDSVAGDEAPRPELTPVHQRTSRRLQGASPEFGLLQATTSAARTHIMTSTSTTQTDYATPRQFVIHQRTPAIFNGVVFEEAEDWLDLYDVTPADMLSAALATSQDALRELIRSVVREQLRISQVPTASPACAYLAQVVREEVRQLYENPGTESAAAFVLLRNIRSSSATTQRVCCCECRHYHVHPA
ncbi:hypothetical protein HPB48_023010 [Haemaphysalis longicornis]|uniref:Galactose-3-O-sulfotransferase n=1 Tax=Haemaphysalis longicornis TaxID=44386 RepID=A0A9J6FQI5_HAELO|nr:hypothetical protein HPB48_023010 [Haemaphysalis longicornis]